eukprot:TRINITY_DN938_c0_g2_i1.p1 TRINITY_DN938_c0_g2~~TRINITY_DN938_c0_g2_i1.p1  ORF type:complete len:209 (-),score=28.68 TRINITY_DN938_c0_g2_i1:85-711(-)
MGCCSTKEEKQKTETAEHTNGTEENMEEKEETIKVLTIGDSNVGKTSLLMKFTDNVFSETLIPTLGSDYKTKIVQVEDKKVKVQVWDTAGQERFRTITASYYKQAQVILICYDTTKKDSFTNVENWFNETSRYASENVIIVIVGCKADLTSEREVEEEDAKTMATNMGLPYVETSSKEGKNVDYCFNVALYRLFENAKKKKSLSKTDW